MSNSFQTKYGPYAIVTGASGGIGEAFAMEIAARGLSLILVARRADKLEVLSRKIKQQFPVEVKCLGLDLSHDGAADALAQETASFDVGLLILNAAVVKAGGFLKSSYEEQSSLVQFNTLVQTQIVHRLGNRMKQQRRGGILFVSSISGFAPSPFQATYGATKAYLSSFGRALSVELSGDGVDVSVLSPGMTETEGMRNIPNIDFSKMKGASAMPAVDVAKAGLDGLGKRVDIVPGLMNKFGAFLFGLLPPSTVARMLGKMTLQALDKSAQ